MPARPVVLSFDDGFADFFTHALPVLKRNAFQATLYVTTAYLGATSVWLTPDGEGDRPMLTWQQLAEVASSGIECGGHTHTHSQLDAIPRSSARYEIEHCKALLEEKLDRPVVSFAYPFGYYDSTVRSMVQRAGYSSACAVKYSASSADDDSFALSRLIVTRDTTLRQFAALVSSRHAQVDMAFQRIRSWAWSRVRQQRNRAKRKMEARSITG